METYCVKCKEPIPELRQVRGSHFCSNDCHRLYRKERRAMRSQKVCRFCGNRIRPKRSATSNRSVKPTTEALRSVQTPIDAPAESGNVELLLVAK